MSLATLVLICGAKGSVLLAAAWLSMRAWPRMSAALRHLLWASALGGLILMPLLSGIVPSLSVRIPTIPIVASIETSQPLVPGVAVRTEQSPVAETPVTETAMSPSFAPLARQRQSIDLREYLPALWACVAALLLLRVLIGRLRLAVLAREASVVDDGDWLQLAQRLAQRLDITRPITLRRTTCSCVPMTWGLVYPTVLLPLEADAWPLERRTIVLLHELAHVNRFDAFTQFVAQLATAVFWFNPFVWLAARSMRVERELACDDCVIACGARPSDYAQDLLQIARSFARSSGVAVAALAMARRGDLEERLMAILDPAANRSAVSRGRAFVAAAAIVALALPLAALVPGAAAAAAVVGPSSQAAESSRTSREQTPASQPAIARVEPKASTVRGVATTQPQLSARDASPILVTSLAGGPQVLVSTIDDSIHAPLIVVAGSPTVIRTVTTPKAPDRETLLSVARAATKLTSSYDKAELLVPIAKYYAGDAELSAAYLAAATTIGADYDCSRTVTALLAAGVVTDDAIELTMSAIATKLTSDYEKANVIVAALGKERMIGPEARSSMIRAIGTIRSDYDRHRATSQFVKGGHFNDQDATDLIKVASGIRSSYDKAEALIEIAEQYPEMRASVRKAYVDATETITSSADYRRAIEALVKHP